MCFGRGLSILYTYLHIGREFLAREAESPRGEFTSHTPGMLRKLPIHHPPCQIRDVN